MIPIQASYRRKRISYRLFLFFFSGDVKKLKLFELFYENTDGVASELLSGEWQLQRTLSSLGTASARLQHDNNNNFASIFQRSGLMYIDLPYGQYPLIPSSFVDWKLDVHSAFLIISAMIAITGEALQHFRTYEKNFLNFVKEGEWISEVTDNRRIDDTFSE